MSDDEQGSATATNADVMGEMLQGNAVPIPQKPTVRVPLYDDIELAEL